MDFLKTWWMDFIVHFVESRQKDFKHFWLWIIQILLNKWNLMKRYQQN